MKIKLIIILFIISSGICNAQWILQPSGTTAAFHDVEFLNLNTGYACGNGVIAKTTNGGQNWTLLSHPATNKFLYSINPIDENLVYCVGYFETILKSTNGGSNWTAIRNGTFGQGASYLSSFFLNQQTGWITGSSQKMLKTTNGGFSFDSIYIFTGYTYDLYFKNENLGIACGDGGEVLRTTNGGLNWYEPNIQLHGNLYNFYQMSVVNDSLVWIIGNLSAVYRSTDFGSNWDSIGFVVGSDETYTVRFSSALTGYCGGTFGRMFKSTNAGFNWKQQDPGPNPGYIDGFWFYNDSIGWAVTGAGKILFTTTGGLTFISNLSSTLPDGFELRQNYPNPFNSGTSIEFSIPRSTAVRFEVYDVLGRLVDSKDYGNKSPGSYRITYDAGRLSSGVYFYTLVIDGEMIATKKMLLIK